MGHIRLAIPCGAWISSGETSWGAEAPKGTNTKVLVEIARRICRDMVASTDRPEETLSAALFMSDPNKKRIAQEPSASTSSDNANPSEMFAALPVDFAFAVA